MKNNKIIVTGASGFIGMHICKNLLSDGYEVLGIDNMNNYYDPKLKEARLAELTPFANFSYEKMDISNLAELDQIFNEFKPQKVVNLAAQPGVRYSLENPHVYIQTNVVGFMNILESCRHHEVEGLIYASSSSVYGGNEKIPFSINDRVDHPISIYAATKKSNELMAYTYSHLFGLHTTGLRFFTVYGPWGRPDMAVYSFTDKIHKGKPIPVFNHGKMKRDFTYIDDIIQGLRTAIDKNYACEVLNLGNNHWEELMDVITIIEKELDQKADIQFMDMQAGDVERTFADIEKSIAKLDYKPKTNVDKGLKQFIDWYLDYEKRGL
jgi:UDP-glucuronate 4-epimerase